MVIKKTNPTEQHYSIKSNIIDTKLMVKDVSTSSRIVTGFFSMANVVDDACDVVLPGAFKKTIKERGPKSDATAKIKHCVDHDLSVLKMPGVIQTLEEKEIEGMHGLYFETLMADTTLGNDVLKGYMMGMYDNHSIGYRVVDYKFIERINEKAWADAVGKLINPKASEGLQCMWLLKEIQLWEGSTVSFGCNEFTPFMGMKSNNPEIFKLNVMNRFMSLQNALKNGTQSDETMINFELQLKQLQQIFSDVLGMVPEENFKKEKIIETPINNQFDWDSFAKNFKL